MPQLVLGSWKEIAQFMGKGVRTVQRWEQELKLPVHRPSASRKGVVIAFPEELQRWIKQQAGSSNGGARSAELTRMKEYSAELHERTSILIKNLALIREQCKKAFDSAQRVQRGPEKTGAAPGGNGRPPTGGPSQN